MITLQVRTIMLSTLPKLLPGRQDAETPRSSDSAAAFGGVHRILSWGVPLIVVFALSIQTARAQDQHKRKVPIVDKLTAGGSQQAFTGKVETLDLMHHVMELNATESKSLEIFPVKKGISVTSANGVRMSLTQLKPGNEVIVYYEQKGDRRTVKEIVLLTAGSADKPKKSAPPS